MRFWKPLILLTALFYCAGVAPAQESYRQQRANLTIRVDSFAQAADDLREITSQFDASIQNLNLNRDNQSGNANIRVAPGQMADVVRELSNMGLVENQSQSENDFTNSYRQYQGRLEVFRNLRGLDMKPTFSKLPSDVRGQAESEYQNWLKGQVESAESSLRSYKEQAAYAEVYVNFTRDPEAVEQPQQIAPDKLQSEEPASPPAPPARGGTSPEFFVLCLINILGLWLIYRRVDNNVAGLRD